ncbi:LysR family transcriptional regulator [Accumulibacter sp.]|uniref:LysR family transcriptional regulator n=1 Tax=Accumulibacter sp. TaxID=2053492 RepID=UPI002C0A3361|nr:LysR family transcriptional regulator [Accumulibacter sp.]HNG86253.1 LysR family transcriptional regulator [Accumulibacter sp.]HNL95853.1 LysR family transcriptional regulator [Accumulibacter sp.]HNN83220.1 LysR family transcriptional regulator [Accumulibacter sp.]
MIYLRDIEIFVATAEAGSLSEAARQLDLTPAAASASLKRLERELHVALFVRSTRSLRLTQEGEVYLQHCRQGLHAFAEGRSLLAGGDATVRGTLQISLPSDLGRNVVLPWLDDFQTRYPQLQIRVQLSDRIAGVFRQPIDIALRYGLPPDSNLVVLPVAPANRRVLCAAPAYLARAGTPKTPTALIGHNCLCFLLGDSVHDRWRFTRGGRDEAVRVRGDRVADDGDAVRRWALAGRGIAYKSALDVADDLRAGRLIALCTDWQGEPAPLNLVCADRRQINPAVRELRAFLAERCAALPAALAGALP